MAPTEHCLLFIILANRLEAGSFGWRLSLAPALLDDLAQELVNIVDEEVHIILVLVCAPDILRLITLALFLLWK